jgi:hypothetical protein
MMKLSSPLHAAYESALSAKVKQNAQTQPQFAGLLDGKIKLKLKASDQQKLAYIQEKLGMSETEALSFVSILSPGMDFFPSNENHTLYLMDKGNLDKTTVTKGSEAYPYSAHEINLTPDQFKDWMQSNLWDVSTRKTWTEIFSDMVPFRKKSVEFNDGRHRDTAQVFYSCIMLFGLPLLAIVPRHDKKRVVTGIKAAYDALKQKEANPDLELVKVTIQPNYPKTEPRPKRNPVGSFTKWGLAKKIAGEIKDELFNRPAVESYTLQFQKVDLVKKACFEKTTILKGF